jgi:hypothetical protein
MCLAQIQQIRDLPHNGGSTDPRCSRWLYHGVPLGRLPNTKSPEKGKTAREHLLELTMTLLVAQR